MKYKKIIIAFTLGLLATVIVMSCSGGSDTQVVDTTIPITTANIGSGTYGSVQYITLQTNEEATIYYSNDGNDPSVDGTNTISGVSPISGIEISEDTLLKFFAIDNAGNQEDIKSEQYIIDLTVPTISFLSPIPEPFSLLTSSTIQWQSDEEGDYVVELGGTGTQGTGEVLALGHVVAGVSVSQEINGTQLSYSNATPLWIYLTDLVGNTGSASLDMTMKPIIEVSTGLSIDFLPDGSQAYVSSGKNVNVIDTDPLSNTYHTIVDSIPFTDPVSDVVVVPDASRVYVTLPGVDKIAVIMTSDNEINTTIDAGSYPNGMEVTPDGSRIYYLSYESFVKVLDVDPQSGSYNSIVQNIITHPTMLGGKVGISSSGADAVINWQGTIAHAVDIIDSNLSSPSYNLVVASPVPVISGSHGGIAFSPDSRFAYITTSYTCRVCKIDLQTYDMVAQNDSIYGRGVAISADGNILMVGSGNSTKIELFNASNLSFINNIDIGFPFGFDMVVSPDGGRMYVFDSNTGKLMMIPLL